MAIANQPKDGGYCSRCDTVWASPGKCRCEMVENKILGSSEGYSYFVDGQGLVVDKNSWNAAIEAAAKCAEHEGYFNGGKTIRKLKK